MNQLSIALLGSPMVRRDDQPVKFATRKALALLCYLAVEARPVSRATLINLLWPDSDSKHGRTVLRTTLTQLRQSLSETAAPAQITLVQSEGDALEIDPRAIAGLDLNTLERGATLKFPSTPFAGQSMTEMRAILEQAAASYRGDFLTGFSLDDAAEFDDWMAIQREKWHQRLSVVLDRLSKLEFDAGEFARGVETAQRWVAHDPLNETAYRRLIQLHLAAGHRSGALVAFEACKAVLRRELNADPSHATQALAAQAKTQRLPSVYEEEGSDARARFSLIPLLGRASEHGALIAAYRAARHGQPQAVVIAGEPGIGKSRLAHEFAGWCASQGAAVLLGAAYDTAAHLPYQLWIDCLRRHIALDDERKTVQALDAVWQMELSRLLPEIRMPAEDAGQRRQTTPAHDRDTAESRIHLFESVFRFTDVLTQDHPLIAIFDDAQWADTASLDMLNFVAHRWAESGRPVLLVATARVGDMHTLQPVLSALQRQMHLSTVSLQPLTQDATHQLVQALLGSLLAPGSASMDQSHVARFSERLFQDTAGHPLYLIETVKALCEIDLAQTENAIDAGVLSRWQALLNHWVAPGVIEVIQSRLQRLQPDTMSLLNALAVLGQANSFDLCRAIAGLDEDPALAGLETCKARGLVREAANGSLSFTHDKIREVVYAGISTARRRSLHRRAGEAHAQHAALHADEDAPTIAMHFDAAGDERAFDYFVRAGQAAMRIYAYADAASYFGRSIALMGAQPGRVARADAALKKQIIAAHKGKASACTQLADYGSTIVVCQQLEQLARQWGDDALALNMMVWRATQLAVPGEQTNLDLAEALAREALPLARELNMHIEEINAQQALARVACWRADFAQAKQHNEAALRVLHDHPNPTLQAYTLNDMALACQFSHDFAAAEQYQRMAEHVWRRLDKPSMLVNSLCIAARTATTTGLFTEALTLFEEALAISTRVGAEWARINSLSNGGIALIESGQFQAGLTQLELAARDSRERHLLSLHLLTSIDLALIYRESGEPERAIAVLVDAHSLTQSVLPAWQTTLIPELVKSYVAAGDLKQAGHWLHEAQSLIAHGHDLPIAGIRMHAATAALELALGNLDQAHAHSLAYLKTCREQKLLRYVPLALRNHSRILRAQGKLEEAGAALNEAQAEAMALVAQWSLAQIARDLSGN